MGAEVVTDYAYDEINRLTREVTCDFMNEYYYDDGGNRTKLIHMNAVYSKDGNGRIVSMLTKASESNQGLTKTYYYANFTELTKMTASEYGGTTRDYTYEHDMAGRLTRQVQNVFSPNSTTTYNYEWDALDRMTKVQRVASGVTKTINYTYNAAGLRVRRVDTSTNVTKLWTYQGNNIASVQESAGGSYGASDYVYTVGPGMINNVTERHLHTDTGAESWYYQYDHRGNVVAVTDYSGKILRGYQYDAFGNIPFSFATGQSGAAPTDDILFTGKDLDPDTGLYYFNARWYDAETGRYVSRTLFNVGIEHPYVLGENMGPNAYDPNGLLSIPFIGWIDVGENAGARAVDYYADISTDPNSPWYARWSATVGGVFASLWTPCTSDATFVTLTTAWGVGQWAGRPFYQYFPKENPGYTSPWLTRGWGWKAPYEVGEEAARKLSLPPYNPGTAVRRVFPKWYEPVMGPGWVPKKFGMPGGGIQYIRGWWFPK